MRIFHCKECGHRLVMGADEITGKYGLNCPNCGEWVGFVPTAILVHRKRSKLMESYGLENYRRLSLNNDGF